MAPVRVTLGTLDSCLHQSELFPLFFTHNADIFILTYAHIASGCKRAEAQTNIVLIRELKRIQLKLILLFYLHIFIEFIYVKVPRFLGRAQLNLHSSNLDNRK